MLEKHKGSQESEFAHLKRLIGVSKDIDSTKLNKALAEGKINDKEFIELAQELFRREEKIIDGLADSGMDLKIKLDASGIDPVTGLKKLNSLSGDLDRWVKELNYVPKSDMERRRTPLKSLMVIALDVDNLTNWNNDYGHPVGDQVLKALSDSLKKVVRDPELIFRRGDKSDEIIIVIRNIEEINEEDVLNTYAHIKEAANGNYIQIDGDLIPVTAAAGFIVVKPGEHINTEKILARADANQLSEKEPDIKNRRIEEAWKRLRSLS